MMIKASNPITIKDILEINFLEGNYSDDFLIHCIYTLRAEIDRYRHTIENWNRKCDEINKKLENKDKIIMEIIENKLSKEEMILIYKDIIRGNIYG